MCLHAGSPNTRAPMNVVTVTTCHHDETGDEEGNSQGDGHDDDDDGDDGCCSGIPAGSPKHLEAVWKLFPGVCG